MDYELLIGIFPQVVLDGILLGFMYALIALGYTMVYGVLEFINFAHSEIFIFGAFVGVEILLSLQSAGWLVRLPWPVVLVVVRTRSPSAVYTAAAMPPAMASRSPVTAPRSARPRSAPVARTAPVTATAMPHHVTTDGRRPWPIAMSPCQTGCVAPSAVAAATVVSLAAGIQAAK